MKFIKITEEIVKDGTVTNFKIEGYSEFEVIGLLTYYRDTFQVDIMNKLLRNEKPDNKYQKSIIDIEKCNIKEGTIYEVEKYYDDGNFQLIKHNYLQKKENFIPACELEFLRQEISLKT